MYFEELEKEVEKMLNEYDCHPNIRTEIWNFLVESHYLHEISGIVVALLLKNRKSEDSGD